MKTFTWRRVVVAATLVAVVSATTAFLSGYKYGRVQLRHQLHSAGRMSDPAAAVAVTPTSSGAPGEAAGSQGSATAAAKHEDINLFLPRTIYAVPGVELNMYFENLV